jgi:hypothetical protein
MAQPIPLVLRFRFDPIVNLITLRDMNASLLCVFLPRFPILYHLPSQIPNQVLQEVLLRIQKMRMISCANDMQKLEILVFSAGQQRFGYPILLPLRHLLSVYVSRRLRDSLVNNGAAQQISATGALLDYIARARAVGELEDEGISGLEIRSIEFLAL